MRIAYMEPLQRGWDRMEKSLFHPFDINKWFSLGFTAFLAGLTDFHGGGSGDSGNYWDRNKVDWVEFIEFPFTAWQWLLDHALWFGLIIFGVFVLIILSIVFTWLSSRGKFMFLDNVIHNRAKVRDPWNEFRREGDSLFVWRLVFGFIVFILIVAFLIFAFIMIRNAFYDDYSTPGKVLLILGLVLQLLVFIIVISYISLFLNDFVVPLMYKYRLSATQAWGRFMKILSLHPGHFILYGLLIFVLGILVVLCVMLFGLFTCCIGFVLLIIPYIGSVLLLPVSYTFRAFSVEYLEQFDEDLKFFPDGSSEEVQLKTV